MNETTKTLRFLVDCNDINTGEHYPAGTEIELTRTEHVFEELVSNGIVELLSEE